MSDAVTNVEIEDVLLSVKRLISETNVSTSPNPERNRLADDVVTRLVLTPALRVEDEDSVDSAPVSKLKPLLLEPAQASPFDVSGVGLSEEPAGVALEAKIAELEAAVTSQAEDWEPDGSEEQDDSDLNSVVAIKAPPELQDVSKLSEQVEDTADDEPDKEAIEEAIVEPLQVQSVEAEPDDNFGDDLQDEDEDEDGLPIPDNLDENIASYIAGGPQMDQSALRDLIVEVVQQELRGEMGERVTRNVRKMVRREIHRALAAQKLT